MCTVLIQPTNLPVSSQDHSATHHSEISCTGEHHLHSAHVHTHICTHTHASHSSSSFPKHTHVVNKAYASCHSQNNTGQAISGKKYTDILPPKLPYSALTTGV